MIGLLSQVRTVTFISGAVVGAVAVPVLKSKAVRKATVTVLSKGYTLKQQVEEQWANIREEAEDLYAEAACKAEEEGAKKAKTTVSDDVSSTEAEAKEAVTEEEISLDDISDDWK